MTLDEFKNVTDLSFISTLKANNVTEAFEEVIEISNLTPEEYRELYAKFENTLMFKLLGQKELPDLPYDLLSKLDIKAGDIQGYRPCFTPAEHIQIDRSLQLGHWTSDNLYASEVEFVPVKRQGLISKSLIAAGLLAIVAIPVTVYCGMLRK